MLIKKAFIVAVAACGFAGSAQAIVISFDPGTPSEILNGGNLMSTPGTVGIAEVGSYVAGGTGLTGIATCWPSGAACDPGGVPVSPAAAASAIDHYWLQGDLGGDAPIAFRFAGSYSSIVAVAGIDHGPSTWRVTRVHRVGFG